MSEANENLQNRIEMGEGGTDGDRRLAELVLVTALLLVDDEDQVKVVVVVGENTTVLKLHVAKTDLGKIIGKSGRTAQAIRTVLIGASAKLKKRSVLDIVE